MTDALEARRLVELSDQVGFVPGPAAWRVLLARMSRGRLAQADAWRRIERLGTPWEDYPCWERTGWRTRSAILDGESAFDVDYVACAECGMGWVEMPYTDERYQRCGLASAGLAALRREHPGLAWHTLGGHSADSRAFWRHVGEGVVGEYSQAKTCPHVRSW